MLTGIFEHLTTAGRHIALIKTDLNGKELWRKKIYKSAIPTVHTGQAIVQDTATRRIIITGWQYIGTATQSETYSSILICDSVGNRITQKTFNNGGGGGFGEVIQLRDKNFLTCGAWKAYDVGATTYYNSMVVKFDIDGNVVWSQIYPQIWNFNGLRYLHELADGDIMMQGIVDSAGHPNQIIPPQILRTDKNGNIKWSKYIGSAYGYNYGFEFAKGFNATKDGGFVMATIFPYAPNSKFYSIIKIDSNACDTTEAYCRSVELSAGPTYQLQGFRFNFFPNPAQGALTIELDVPVYKNYEVLISDISGTSICELKIEGRITDVNVSRYLPGTYIVRLIHNGQARETKKLVIVR